VGFGFFIDTNMNYVIPQNTKGQVNEAGNILSNPSAFTLKEKLWAHDVLNNWRASHAYPMNTFQATLRARLKNVDSNGIVAQRLKRTPSIINKLQRFGDMKLARMQDIGGLRSVVDSITKVRKLESLYLEGGLQHELKPPKDYITIPKEDGYRGIHLIFKYKNAATPDYDDLLLELQIRTKLQHAWASAVETMGTFLGQALKSGQGNDEWRKFFSAAGAAFSHVEDAPPVPGYEQFTRIESYQYMAELEQQLGVLDKLRSFSIATDKIITSQRHASYHLIILDSINKTVNINPYAKHELERASADYSSIERKIEDGEMIEAVLVSAGSVEALKRAYPNYFLDTNSFISRVRRLISESKKNGNNSKYSSCSAGGYRMYPEIAAMQSAPRLKSKYIPQADRLDSIRDILEAVDRGSDTINKLEENTNINRRHILYRISSAEILSTLCRDKNLKITTYGHAWLKTQRGGEDEAALLRELIENSYFYNLISPELFGIGVADKDDIVNRIVMYSNMSRSTALRRATTISAWYSQLANCRFNFTEK
jgi:hypothetical protein